MELVASAGSIRRVPADDVERAVGAAVSKERQHRLPAGYGIRARLFGDVQLGKIGADRSKGGHNLIC